MFGLYNFREGIGGGDVVIVIAPPPGARYVHFVYKDDLSVCAILVESVA